MKASQPKSPTAKASVSIVLPSMRGGGAERVMLNVANALADQGYEVDLVLVSAIGPYLSDISDFVNIVDLHRRRSFDAIGPLVRHLRRRRPSVMICALPHISILGIIARFAATTRTKVIIVEHNTISQTIANSRSIKTQVLHLLMRLFYRYGDQIIAVSQGVARDLEKTIRLDSGSVSVIYNPVITPQFERMTQQQLKHPWYKRDSPPVILGIGRLTYAKNFSMLIESFHEVRRKMDVKLIILGEGPDREALTSLIQSLGLEKHVLLPGFVDNPYPFLRESALFVLSSRWEGLPTVLIEALACGTPVVSTDCPSGPREILRNGELGRLVPCSDKTTLTEAIHHTLSEDAVPMTDETMDIYRLDYAVNQYMKTIDLL